MTDILDSDDNNENEDDTEYHSYNNNKNSKHAEKSNNLNKKRLNNKQNEEEDEGEGEGEGEGGSSGANDKAIKLLLKHLASISSHNNKLDIMLTEMLVNSKQTHEEIRNNIDKYLSHEADQSKGLSL